MKFTNKSLPAFYGDHIIRALERDPYAPGDAWISATALVNPPMIRRLRREYDARVERDVMDMIWALVGQAMHHVLSRGDGGDSFTEERLFSKFGDRVVSGAFDLYGREEATGQFVLSDWKFTSAWSFVFEKETGGLKPEWEAQLNVLAELLRRNGFKVDRIEIVAILKDWSLTKSKESADYPKNPVIVVPAPLWDPEDVTDYINERIQIHEKYTTGLVTELEPCTPDERWEKRTEYKVQKNGRTIPGGIKNDYRDAVELVELLKHKGEHSILKVQGEPTRCAGNYCGVREFCAFGKQFGGQ